MGRRQRRHGDFSKFILLALLRKGPLSLADLEHMTATLVAQFEVVGVEFGTRIVSGLFSRLGRPAVIRPNAARGRSGSDVDMEAECAELVGKGLIARNGIQQYLLTAVGKAEAELFAQQMARSVSVLERQFASPTAAARNTMIIDLVLATLKLAAGLLSGSVGLLADGADAAVDTVSAVVVWIGMKVQKEVMGTLAILVMMFVTGVSVGYESLTSLLEAVAGTLTPIARPFLVMGTEAVALLIAVGLFLYQRFVGKRYGSLALISQSVDSKNHIYVAALVIVGAILTVGGIPFVDAVIGAVVAAKILIDAVGLVRDLRASLQGEAADLAKYPLPLEEQWHLSKMETFRTWILYLVQEKVATTRDALITALERTFKPEYVPILHEFRFSLGRDIDFDRSFDELTQPLLDEELLVQREDTFVLTAKGRNRVNRMVRSLRFRQGA